ncbi:MAG: zf-TFIIB domain-containing protein, partial [bacterium]|nr:zf-TFIIB domain-containing protein [bacterium]
MKCPVDKSDMLVVEYEAIELDYCPHCRGVWFDSSELDLLLPAIKLERAGLPREGVRRSAEAKSAEMKRKCPVCGRKMRKSTLGRDSGVLIDICPRGEGLWFDGGEVE